MGCRIKGLSDHWGVGPKGCRTNMYAPCKVCNRDHDVKNCASFLNINLNERKDFLKENHLCFGCYGQNHISIGCIQKHKCDTCGKRHPTALHDPNFTFRGNNDAPSTQQTQEQENSAQVQIYPTIDTVWEAVLPVKVKQNGKEAVTYALLDTGSTGCFMTESLQKEINAESTDVTLRLRTVGGTTFSNTSVAMGLIVSDMSGNNVIKLPKTYIKEEIPVSHQQIPKPHILKQWSHLKELATKLPSYNNELEIGLLIGSNCPTAMEPLQVIPTEGNGPLAVRYRLGWTISGPCRVMNDENSIVCNRIVVREISTVRESILPAEILQMMELDFSERDTGTLPGECAYSQEDKEFMKYAEKGITFENGHYEVPLPFRDPEETIHNNRSQALKRILWQKEKMLKDPKYLSDYTLFISKLLQKGYAYKVPAEEVNEKHKVRYLPHHGVYHPKKGKIRVVFDCSAKFQGQSLNDTLLTGPDLTNSLVGVLTRFRQEQHAFMADIESMFYQVRVPKSQHNLLRFLWWPEGNLDAQLEEYCMSVHIFGAASSPSIANFALKTTADRAEQEYSPLVADTIRHNFYVDDCLKSVSNETVGMTLVSDLYRACANGGFHLTKFMSNNIHLLSSLPEEECAADLRSLDFDNDSTLIERALGIQWDIKKDQLRFSVQLKANPVTRRGILSTISSIYDPLGFIAPLLLPAKKILQDLCNADIGWDDDIPNEYKDTTRRISERRCLYP